MTLTAADYGFHPIDPNAPTAAFGSPGRFKLAAYDDFSDYPNGGIAGNTPAVGETPWSVTGAQAPTVTGGRLSSSGTGYAYLGLDEVPDVLACGIEFTTLTGSPMTMSWVTGSAWSLDNLNGHFNFGPAGFNLTIKRGAAFHSIAVGTFKKPLAVGVTHTVSIAIVGDCFVMQVGNETFACAPDPRVRALAGRFVFWEPASTARLAWAGAWVEDADRTPLLPEVTARTAAFSQGGNRQIIGNRNEMQQVLIGQLGNGQPGIEFGAGTIVTELTTAATAGGTTLVTRDQIPPGATVVIDQAGATEESRTTSGYPVGASTPYTHTVTAGLTSAHPVGTVVVVTVPTSGRASAYLNLANGMFFLPDVSRVIVPGDALYLGDQQDTGITRAQAGIVALVSGNGLFVDGTVFIGNATKGAVMKSANGKYWRVTISDTGVLTTADLGTSFPGN